MTSLFFCDECGEPIDQSWDCCHNCGLEIKQIDDFVSVISAKTEANLSSENAKFSDEQEDRERKIRMKAVYGKQRGFVCHRCERLFERVKADNIVRMPGDSFEQPGTNFYTFILRQELDFHIKTFHKGNWYLDRSIATRLTRAEERNNDRKP